MEAEEQEDLRTVSLIKLARSFMLLFMKKQNKTKKNPTLNMEILTVGMTEA